MSYECEGPTRYVVPAHKAMRCGLCKYHNLIGQLHVRIGEGGWREYACSHPEAFDPAPSNDTPEQAEIRGALRQHQRDMHGGRHIGRTEDTPQWCPFLRKEKP